MPTEKATGSQWKVTFLLFKKGGWKKDSLNFTVHPNGCEEICGSENMEEGVGEMPQERGVETLKGGGSHPYGMDEGVGEMPMEKEGETGSVPAEEEKFKGTKPDFRVVQPQVDKEGKQQLVDVGALWKNVSRSGNEFYTLKIGKLKLLVFENRFKE